MFHPLPAGLRDALPTEACARRDLVRVLLETFAESGHEVVIPPLFELADVLERGMGPGARAEMLTFVEPESGEIAALRPDMTPQIARLVATRLQGTPLPLRLCYEGSVVRRRAGRARKRREIPQVGAELIGLGAPEGDLALLETLGAALRRSGLAAFTVDLQDAQIVHALLEDAGPEQAREIGIALAHKDETAVRVAARGLAHAAPLAALTHVSGGREALHEAASLLAGTTAAPFVARLAALCDALERRELFPRIMVDIGEVREFDYYTGCMFHVFAEGPGEPIAAGGRYDRLLSRFGMDACAVGFGIDVDNLSWALSSEAC